MSETIHCPCGMSGASRLIAVHRTTCPAWIEKIAAKMGAPQASPLCSSCGFIHAASEPCPTDHDETPTTFGGDQVPHPFVQRPAPAMKMPIEPPIPMPPRRKKKR